MNESRDHELREVFHADSRTKLDDQIARICVLFEDLRIEVIEMSKERQVANEIDPVGHRLNYFLRRSIATLNEFGDGLAALDSNKEFKGVKDKFDGDARRIWSDALKQLKAVIGKRDRSESLPRSETILADTLEKRQLQGASSGWHNLKAWGRA